MVVPFKYALAPVYFIFSVRHSTFFMAELKIEKHKWQPSFKDETWIIDKRKQEEFQITLKQGKILKLSLHGIMDMVGEERSE